MDERTVTSRNHRHSVMQQNHLLISQTGANWHTDELMYRLSLIVCRNGGFAAPCGGYRLLASIHLYQLAIRGFRSPHNHSLGT